MHWTEFINWQQFNKDDFIFCRCLKPIKGILLSGQADCHPIDT